MNGLKKLRQTLRRNGNKSRSNNKPLNEVYIYTPLPNHKNGYIIEFRHSDSSEIYYYKYKEIAGGTLTKYGYLVCDHYIRNYDNSKYNKNDFSEEIDYKTLFSVNSDDKECIFYQTVADKEQIALEKLKENVENVENYNNYYEFYTPPLSPKTPPSSPTENFANITQKSLLNMNIRQRDKNKGKKYQEEQQQPKEKVKKLIHLTQPKFRKTPMVYTYDPEDALEYKDCRCDYCLIDDYYE
ncbi:hypothetical protein RhiirB3_521229 [Rhizophagus irregularis]|nr:hypothetical protein RhiirB3_521229 [Rhizophagus irregularis]